MDAWARLIATGRAQGGPIAVRQALELGIPRSTFDDRVRRERWNRPFPGVAVLPGCVPDAAVVARAAALTVGEHAIVTGVSALAMHGVCDVAFGTHPVVPEGRRARRPERVRVTRSRTLRDEDGELLDGVPVATVPRALLDAAARAGRDRLRTWIVDGRQRRLLDVAEEVRRAATAVGVPGRGRLLMACGDVDTSAADSALAAEVERRLRRSGFHLDAPTRAVAVPDRMLHPDLTICGLAVGIEVDGFGSHAMRRGWTSTSASTTRTRSSGGWCCGSVGIGWPTTGTGSSVNSAPRSLGSRRHSRRLPHSRRPRWVHRDRVTGRTARGGDGPGVVSFRATRVG